jgi:hypothetical protein
MANLPLDSIRAARHATVAAVSTPGSRRVISRMWPSVPAAGLAALLLVLLVLAEQGQLLSAERVLLPTDLIFSLPMFQSAAPAGFNHPSNALLSDVVFAFYPWAVVTRETLQQGYFPFWNQYVFAGSPHFANFQSAVLYPLNVLSYLLPLNLAINLTAIVRLVVAGCGMVLFARELRVGFLGMVVAGATFMLGGSMTVWLSYPISNSYAWMPTLFFLGERLIRTNQTWYIPALIAVLATIILGGQPQIAFIVLFAWSVYCGARLFSRFRVASHRRAAVMSVGLLISAGVISLLVTAVQLLPSWEWLDVTNESYRRASMARVDLIDPAFGKNLLAAVVSMVVPNFFGNPTWGGDLPLSFVYSNYLEQTVYVGIAPLVFSIMALWSLTGKRWVAGGLSPEERGLIILLGAMAALFLGLAVYAPGLELVTRLPVFNMVWPQRYRLVVTFCLAALAGIGAHRLGRGGFSRRAVTQTAWWLVVTSLVSVCVLTTVAVALRVFKEQVITIPRWRGLYDIMLYGFSLENVGMYASVAVAIVFAVFLFISTRRSISRTWLHSLCTGFVIADLLVFGSRFNPTVPATDVFPSTLGTRFLAERLASGSGRVLALSDTLPADVATPYGLRDVAGYDYLIGSYSEFVQAMGGVLEGSQRVAFSTLGPNALALLNVSYVIGKEAPQGPGAASLREVARDGTVRIYENSAPVPRAHIVRDVWIEPDRAKALDVLKSPEFEPNEAVLLQEAPSVELPTNGAVNHDLVTIVADRGPELEIQTTTSSAGYLVLADAYYPGWQAEVDDVTTRIYRADYAFRAIYLPEGSHVVRFHYTPTWFDLGLRLSVMGLVLTVGVPFGLWLGRRRLQGRQRRG